MGYGTPKILNSEIKEYILEAVSVALDKQGDVFQGNQAYYGYAATVTVELHLIARGEEKLKITTGAANGEKPEPEKDGKLPEPKETAKTTTATATRGKQKVAVTGG